ncbi:MAG: ABC transporter substrate-binding protein [Geminicoccales bacterium]
MSAKSALSRRYALKVGATALLVSGMAPAVISCRAKAQQKTLRILRWKHFVPGYDTWFNETFIKEWGDANDTEVIVDNVGLGEIGKIAAEEAKLGKGHDLVLFLAPPPSLEDHVIDHREIFEECEQRYGKAIEFARRGSYNPRTDKYYGVCESYAPTVLSYRKDLWDAVGEQPDSWDDIRKGGRKIKLLHEKSVGLSLAPEHNSKHSVRAILYAFGGAIQDADGNPALKSGQTLEAVKFAKALYEEAMTDDTLTWDPPANNRFILSEEGCLTIDTLSIPRAAESKSLPVDANLALARLPEGPAGRIGPNFGAYTYAIWQFAENMESAKQFLVDYVGHSETALTASGFQNMPSFPAHVPGLGDLLKNDPVRPERYAVLADVAETMTNLGQPGYANAATDEVLRSGIISTLFAKAATGQLSPEDALDEADKAILPIFEKWKGVGKI